MIDPSTTSLVKCNQTNSVWLFNCTEGSQHFLMKQRIRIHQINNIVLTNLSLEYLAGLMGLLSSLSLNSHIQTMNIYGPPGISNYLQLARKYSQTTFKFNLEIHILSYGYFEYSLPYLIYSYPVNPRNNQIEYIILEKEKIGRLLSIKAKNFNIITGSLYAHLKSQNRFIMPDGYIIAGKFFTCSRSQGFKIPCLVHRYGYRSSIELTIYSTEIVC
jgi:ribonuclease Z